MPRMASRLTRLRVDSDGDAAKGHRRRRRVLRPRVKRRRTVVSEEAVDDGADRRAEYAKIAMRMLKDGNLMLCDAFVKHGDPAGVWFYDGKMWHHPFGSHGSSQGLFEALKKPLVEAACKGRLSIPFLTIKTNHVKEFINTVKNFIIAKRPSFVVMNHYKISDMRTKARTLLPMRGGCLDLSGEKPVIVLPTPREALFSPGELLPADCPRTLEELEKHGYDDLLNMFKAVLSDEWGVFFECVVLTICGNKHQKFPVFHGPRSVLKSSVAVVLGTALGPARCPMPGVDAAMASERWATRAADAPEKAKINNKFGNSYIRGIDEVDSKARRVHYASIKGEQTPYGMFGLPYAFSFVKAPVLPMYYCTTNDPPEDIFTAPVSAKDAEDILLFDTSKNVFVPGKVLTKEEAEPCSALARRRSAAQPSFRTLAADANHVRPQPT